MRTIETVAEMQRWSDERRRAGQTVAFVPTMGFLHEGHLSLVRRAREVGTHVVVSIFVNPMQFNQSTDYDAYPHDKEKDVRLLKDLETQVLFMPSAKDLYPVGFQSSVEVSETAKPLCGAVRPGHFKGVTTVVAKLFNMVKPHYAVFGEKDFQQCTVIRRMVEDLNFDVEIVVMPTVREPDGLAMSSRNARLSEAQRESSLRLFAALSAAQQLAAQGQREARALLACVRDTLTADKALKIEYVSLCDPRTLLDVDEVSGPARLAIAVWIGDVRLIDNCLVT